MSFAKEIEAYPRGAFARSYLPKENPGRFFLACVSDLVDADCRIYTLHPVQAEEALRG
jgi:hypothetical protein